MNKLLFLCCLCVYTPVVEALNEKQRLLTFSLPNGLSVLVHENHDAPVVSIGVSYPTGIEAEYESKKPGMVYLFEQLYPLVQIPELKQNFLKAIQGMGASTLSYHQIDHSMFISTFPSHQIDMGLWLEAQRMGQLFVDTLHFERKKKIAIEAYKQNTTNPYFVAKSVLFAHDSLSVAYQTNHHYNEANLKQIKSIDWLSFCRKYGRFSGVVLSIVGDIQALEIRDLVYTYYSSIELPTQALLVAPDRVLFDTSIQHKKIVDSLRVEGATHNLLILSYPIVSIRDKQYEALKLGFYLLATKLKDYLSQQACTIYTNWYEAKYKSLADLVIEVSSEDNVESVDKYIQKALQTILEQGISEKDVQQIKNFLETEREEAYMHHFSIALNKDILDAAFYFDSADQLSNIQNVYAQIGVQEIKEVWEQYLTPTKQRRLYVLPSINLTPSIK